MVPWWNMSLTEDFLILGNVITSEREIQEEIIHSCHGFLVLLDRRPTHTRMGVDMMTWSRTAFKAALN